MATAETTAIAGASAPTPAQASQSKREKRRQLINDRVSQLGDSWTKNKDQAFREQLQRIQMDTNLVMRVDPYADRPLDVFEEDEQRIQQLNGESTSAPRSYLEMAGPRFFDWMIQIQDLVEQRDYALTKYKFDYEKKTSEYLNTHAFKIETADREYKALSQTLRDRLINAITTKKYRLNKEKEALEISDASALLLHPNQFSITNPASPGGAHGKRTTRARREMEEMSLDNKKRKRNNNNNDDDGSPVPQRRALDNNNTTPLWQTDRLTMRKATGPIYSIDKLFTDKELSMTYSQSALAAHKYLLTHKPKFDEHGRPIHSPDGSDSGNGENEEDAESVPSAPMMERNVSHATRSGQRGNNPNFMDDKLMGIEMLANFDFPGNFERMLAADPKLPPTFPSTYIKGHNRMEYNVTNGLANDDVNGDMMVMQALKQYDQVHGAGSNFAVENGSRTLLQAASLPARDRRFVAYLQGERPAENDVRKRLGLPVLPDTVEPVVSNERSSTPRPGHIGTPGQSPAKGFGGVAMSRQSSANGAPMSRTSSRKGGRGGRGG